MTMGRRRKGANAHLPEGVYLSRGWHFYRDPDTGEWHKLGKEWDKAARDAWARLSTGKASPGTVAQLLDAYLIHREQLVREGKLSKRTLADNEEEAKYLKRAFRLPYMQVTSRHVATYLQRRTWKPKPIRGPDGELVDQAPRRAPVRANREISLLSGAYTWGLTSPDFPDINFNPCVGVWRNEETPKTRCPERWEIEAAKQKADAVWSLILDFAYACGQRGIDTRLLQKRALRYDGIRIKQTKGGAELVIEWDAELLGVVVSLLAYSDEIESKLKITSPYVIVTRKGQPYSEAGWKNAVYRIVRAAIADHTNPLEQPFSFHDMRARSATDEEEIYGTNPQHRLGHKKRSTTEIYLRERRVRRVKPLPLRKAS